MNEKIPAPLEEGEWYSISDVIRDASLSEGTFAQYTSAHTLRLKLASLPLQAQRSWDAGRPLEGSILEMEIHQDALYELVEQLSYWVKKMGWRKIELE